MILSPDMRRLLKTILIFGIGSLTLLYCTLKRAPQPTNGKALAEKHCGSCHLPVAPGMLDSATWADNILPAMAPKLGIQVWSKTAYYKEDELHVAGQGSINALPADQSLSLGDWMKIVDYFKEESPKKLDPAAPPREPVYDWSVFTLKKPAIKNPPAARTTLVSFNAADKRIYTGNDYAELTLWDADLRPLSTGRAPSAPVHIRYTDSGANDRQAILTCIGTIDALDNNLGSVLRLSSGAAAYHDTLFNSLPRPVQTAPIDYNKDGLTDWIVCGFGRHQGALYLFRQMKEGGFSKIILKEQPGAIQAEVNDFNGDGWPDLLVLFAQANEEIVLFLNDAKGNFIQKTLLQFPAVQGSSSFQTADFNKDGKWDILYTAGDNADYSNILKPYHGVYIFMNKGDLVFEPSYFYPMNGCYKAMAADMDGDGDMDIAAISFFPDMEKEPREGFFYLEQDGALRFLPHVIPVSEYGRWSCMDINDYDGDGDQDIILGNYSNGAAYKKELSSTQYETQPFIILQNQTR